MFLFWIHNIVALDPVTCMLEAYKVLYLCKNCLTLWPIIYTCSKTEIINGSMATLIAHLFCSDAMLYDYAMQCKGNGSRVYLSLMHMLNGAK